MRGAQPPAQLLQARNRAICKGVAEQHAFHEKMEGIHGTLAWGLLFLLVLHIGGALKHQLVDRMPELARMGLGRRVRA